MSHPIDEEAPLSGVVLDDSGQPMPGVEVRATPHWLWEWEEERPLNASLAPHAARLRAEWMEEGEPTLRTGTDGRFTFPRLQRGHWWVRVLANGYFLDTQATDGPIRWVGPHLGAQAHTGSQDVQLVVTRRGFITGRLMRVDGSPITHFQLNGHNQGDPQGRFFWTAPSQAEELLAFAARELAGTVRRVRAPMGEALDLGDVALGTGRPVHIRLMDADDGGPADLAWLRLMPSESSTQGGSLLFDEYDVDEYIDELKLYGCSGGGQRVYEGKAVLENVEESPLWLTITSPYHLSVHEPLAPTQREVTITLRAGTRLHGQVMDGDKPLLVGEVKVLTPEGVVVRTARISGGWYFTSRMKAGDYIVMVRVTPFSRPEPFFMPKQVQVPDSGEVQVDFEAPREGCTVELVPETPIAESVLVTGKPPMPQTAQALHDVLQLGHSGFVAENGHHIFHHVPSGQYTLFAVHERHKAFPRMHHEELRVPGETSRVIKLRPQWKMLT